METEYGIINISKSRTTGAIVYEIGGCRQSAIDRKGTSTASYIHAIFSLLKQAKAHDILIIGGAGGTLGTLLARAGHKATIVDVNPVSFILAREYFNLPQSVVCHVADGEQFLCNGANIYDAIVIDAFHGDCVPSHLQSRQFFELVRQHLMPHGIALINVHIKHDFDDYADCVAKNMRSVWTDVRVLDAEGVCNRNAIVMAGKVSQLRAPKLLVRPEVDVSAINNELSRLQFRAWKTSRWAFDNQ